jgi:hypothetical protein
MLKQQNVLLAAARSLAAARKNESYPSQGRKKAAFAAFF